MTKLGRTTLITFGCWFLGTAVYAYYWISSSMADAGGYERLPLLHALAFWTYRLPYLLVGLVIIIIVELIIVPWPQGKSPPFE